MDIRPPPDRIPSITLLTFLGFVLAGICGFIAWKLSGKSADRLATDQVLRETLEYLRKDVQDMKDKNKEYFQERLDHLAEFLNKGITETSKTVHGHFRETSSVVQTVMKELTQIQETNKQVLNYSQQLQELQSIFKQPKGRGLISEYWLETMLAHVLQPEQYRMQYAFGNAEAVDAVIFFQEKIIPIDAKFSLDKYTCLLQEKDDKEREQLERDFKNHLKLRIDETAKYIRPQEGTTDFAFMFLPAEGIFYDLLVSAVGTVDVNRMNLMEYAFNRRVIIVSPATFFAYLQTVLQGLKAFKMEESVREIAKNVEQLGRHLNAYEEHMQKLGNHLGMTVNMYNDAYKEFRKIDKDVYKLTEGATGGSVEVLSLDRPTAHLGEITAKKVKQAKEQLVMEGEKGKAAVPVAVPL